VLVKLLAIIQAASRAIHCKHELKIISQVIGSSLITDEGVTSLIAINMTTLKIQELLKLQVSLKQAISQISMIRLADQVLL